MKIGMVVREGSSRANDVINICFQTTDRAYVPFQFNVLWQDTQIDSYLINSTISCREKKNH